MNVPREGVRGRARSIRRVGWALVLLLAVGACSRARKGPTAPLPAKPPDLLAGGTGGAASFTAHPCAALVPRTTALTFFGALDVGELTASKFWTASLPFIARLAPASAAGTTALGKDARLIVYAESPAPMAAGQPPGAAAAPVAPLRVGLSASAELAGRDVVASLRRAGACVTGGAQGREANPPAASGAPALPEVAVALLERLPAAAPLRAVFLRSPTGAPEPIAALLKGTLGSGVAAFELGDNVRLAWVVHAQGAPDARRLAASLRRALNSGGRAPAAPTRYERLVYGLLRSAVVQARGAFVALEAEIPGGLLKALVAAGS